MPSDLTVGQPPASNSPGRMSDQNPNGWRRAETEYEIRGASVADARGNDLEEKAEHIGVEVQPLRERGCNGLREFADRDRRSGYCRRFRVRLELRGRTRIYQGLGQDRPSTSRASCALMEFACPATRIDSRRAPVLAFSHRRRWRGEVRVVPRVTADRACGPASHC